MKKASKITDAERSEIDILHGRGYSARAIALALGRSPNSIATELKRNSHRNGSYTAAHAKVAVYHRRKDAKYQGMKIQENAALFDFVATKLAEHWNPAEIAGYTKNHLELGFSVSKTAIYGWLYSSRGQLYCQHLYSKRYHPRRRKPASTPRTMIPGRIPLSERPLAVQNRCEVGHWEYDSVVSGHRSGSTFALAVVVERTSRLVTATIVSSLHPTPFAQVITTQLTGKTVRSLTTDNGIENKHWRLITEATNAPVFFTDPYSSWQKGSVENANKMLRRYFPKGTDFATVSQTAVVNALERINNKPRKILGYKSALEVAKEKGVILATVS